MERLINEFDEIMRWPKKLPDKENVINWLSTKFTFDQKYTEKEVNEILDRHHLFNDTPLLRRELISRKYLVRKDDGSKYWRVNQ